MAPPAARAWENPVLRLHSESLGQSPRVLCWFRAPDTRAILCHNVFAELTILALAENERKDPPLSGQWSHFSNLDVTYGYPQHAVQQYHSPYFCPPRSDGSLDADADA
jgi:hypothetical protein